ncbi:hypothetical protein [Gordonia sp. NPDC058843]|uniref:hypothetical protein n=1 Tax=Gordonia sp. NPDC058843 TaxID=3346648 RepID=UPI0036845509
MVDENLAAAINHRIDGYFTELAQAERARVDHLEHRREAETATPRTVVGQLEAPARRAFTELAARKIGRVAGNDRVIMLRDTSGLPSTVQPLKFGPFSDRHRYLHRCGVLTYDYQLSYRQGRAAEVREHGNLDFDPATLPPRGMRPDESGMVRWYDENGLRAASINAWTYGAITDSLLAVRSRGFDLGSPVDAASFLLDTDSGTAFIAWNYTSVRQGLRYGLDPSFDDIPRVGVQIASQTWIESVDDYIARIVACEVEIDNFRQTRYRR